MSDLLVRLHYAGAPRLAAEFDCAAGELIALVGPSGSGKTSILRAVAGLFAADALEGAVSLGGVPWFDSARRIRLSPQQRRVGLVFQNYALFPHLSALDNTLLGAGLPGANEQTASLARAMLDRLGLGALASRRPAQLSGGQQQRVALARALMRVAPALADGTGNGVLLLDEPFSAVDAPTRVSLYRELAALRQDLSTPMVLVTHELGEARRLADRVVILDAGESLQCGTPQQVFASPRNARVAQLVGIQNHFRGRFHRDRAGWGRLDWVDSSSSDSISLHVIDKNRLQDGVAVTWVLAGESVDLAFGENGLSTRSTANPNNAVPCLFTEVLALGETSLCTLVPQKLPGQRLTLNLSTAFLRSKSVEKGSPALLLIPAGAIHIMPVRQPGGDQPSAGPAAVALRP